MNVISVASPDKVSLSMFIDFMKFCLGARYSVGSLHSLVTEENTEAYLDGFLKENPQAIIGFFARRRKVFGPGIIPPKLLEVSEALLWFDLYANKPRIIKDDCGFSELYLPRWEKNIERMNKFHV